MKILIVDDHPLFVEGLKNLLQTQDFNIVGTADNGKEALLKSIEKKPDIILMDIGMPEINGIEATRIIKEKMPDVKIIILTSFEEEDSLFKAIKAGASGYLLKSLDGDDLIKSLNDLSEGKNPFSPGLDCIIDSLENATLENKEDVIIDKSLTLRQIEVIKLVAKGLTYQEIAKVLFVSERTIKYHVEQIKEKLNLKNQAHLIAYAIEKKII